MIDNATRRAEPSPSPPDTTAIRCHVTYFDDWARVTAKGRLDVSTVPVLRRMVLAAAVLPISGVTLDLAGVEACDRYAVNALVALNEAVRDQSAAFVLAAISQPVHRALNALGVADRFAQESVWTAYPSPDPQSQQPPSLNGEWSSS